MNKLSIIVPAFNEELQIRQVTENLLHLRPTIIRESGLDDVEIIVVDDGSTDRTGEILSEITSHAPGSLRVVTHETNSGYGAALKTGFREATGEFVSFMDADGTVDPGSFAAMYKALRESDADLVVGKRFGGKQASEMPIVREIGNRFFALFLSFLAGARVRDTASGMRLFKRTVVPLLYALPDGLHFTPAMSTKLLHEKLKIVEVPIPYAERGGESKLNAISDGLRFFRIILSTVLMYNPFKVFFVVGLFCELMAAILIGALVGALATGTDTRFSDYIYRSIGAMYFFTAGIQIMLFGILARFIVATFFRRHESGKWIHRVNRFLKVYDRMGFYGLGVLAVGLAVNSLYFWKYFFGGGLNMHWSWLLFSAGFIIVGIQMVITGVLMRILTDIRAALEEQ
ncbi:MAG: glycosyltransferase family 2 protein [Pseudomonadota bacterium]